MRLVIDGQRLTARRTGVGREGVDAGLARLAKLGLAGKLGRLWFARKPRRRTSEWFAWRRQASGPWYRRLAYYPVWLPSASCPFSPMDLALLFLVASLARPGSVARRTSAAGLGKMLGVSGRTVVRSLCRAQEAGLLAYTSGGRWSDIELLTPPDEFPSWFVEGPHVRPAEQSARPVGEQPPAEQTEDRSERGLTEEQLLARVSRLRGQIEAVERALEQERGCGAVLQLVVAARGAMNSLMAKVIEDHIRTHVVDPARERNDGRARGAEELIEVVQAYLK